MINNNIVGKTIASTLIERSWDDKKEQLTITFTDGSSINIYGHTFAGCNECDPDGCSTTYLEINVYQNGKYVTEVE